MKGTAQRTENAIIVDTPGPVDMSVPIMAMTMTMHIGIETSQNNLHPLMAFFLGTTFRSLLTRFDHLHRNTRPVLAIFSLRALTNDPPDRLRRHHDRAW